MAPALKGFAAPEAWSLLGEPLTPPPLAGEVARERERKLREARAAFVADPEDVDGIIWLGRRTAYLGRYREAIAIYTRGIELHPGDARLYRHRGHRFITIRRLDLALVDLARAASLVEGAEDIIEPDGLPNARNMPTSTLQGNIWYHRGLAYYLQGRFEEALPCYRRCLALSKNPDMLSATSHWLTMTLWRLGKDSEAAAVLEPIRADMDIIENHAYHELLLLYKGERTADQLLDGAAGKGALGFATIGYGLGNWHLAQGRREEAVSVFRRILEGGIWPAFGRIAAEAELLRLEATETRADR